MALSKVAILALRGSKDLKRLLAEAGKKAPLTIYRYIQHNDDELTKECYLRVLRRELNLTNKELLECTEECAKRAETVGVI